MKKRRNTPYAELLAKHGDALRHITRLENAQQEDRALLRRTQDALERERNSNEWRRLVSQIYKRAEEHERNCTTLTLRAAMLEDLKKVRFESEGMAYGIQMGEVFHIPQITPPGHVTDAGFVVVSEEIPLKKIERFRKLTFWQKIKSRFPAALRNAKKRMPL